MSARSILRPALGAALLVNAVPHGVSAVQGKPFPSPFADPPGAGMSAPPVNVAWSALNAVAGGLLLRRGIRTPAEWVAASVAAVAMAFILAFHFGDVLRGGQGLRGLRSRRSGPPRALVHATEPLARALAGRRWMPLWAIIHHRGRRSGTEYATPIAVIPTADESIILIGLPWGLGTNWARNVVAAGGATLTWKGREQQATEPRIVEASVAIGLAKPFVRSVVKGMPGAIVLTRA
jgi:deazaflavin-dependent oxidoreductase (nitroreductase family)